jgi:hypothetical protein
MAVPPVYLMQSTIKLLKNKTSRMELPFCRPKIPAQRNGIQNFYGRSNFGKIIMTMNKKLLLLFFGYCFCQNVSGQAYNAGTIFFNHTDINPDSLMHYVFFPYTHQVVDLTVFGNNPEIEFVADGSSSPGGTSAYINIRSLDTNVFISFGRLDSVYDSTSSSWLVTKVAKVLNAGDLINSQGAVWDNSMLYISDHSGSFGWTKDVNDWIGADRYIGLKYDDGNIVAYGWIKVGCVHEDSCYVREFSSTPIVLGGVAEAANNKMLLYPNPFRSFFTISFDPLIPIDEINIYDITGSCILKKKCTNRLAEEIDLTDQEAGIYLLQVTYKEGTRYQKIIKE